MELEEMRRKEDIKVNESYNQFSDAEVATDEAHPDLESPAEPQLEDAQ
jgi:hypothetical protein